MTTGTKPPLVQGELARAAGMSFPLAVLKSRAGYYIGTCDDEGLPYSRESAEYWQRPDQAQRLRDRGGVTRSVRARARAGSRGSAPEATWTSRGTPA